MPSKLPRSAVNAKERDKKIKWLREVRERVGYFSIVLRPQKVRMMWVNDLAEKEA